MYWAFHLISNVYLCCKFQLTTDFHVDAVNQSLRGTVRKRLVVESANHTLETSGGIRTYRNNLEGRKNFQKTQTIDWGTEELLQIVYVQQFLRSSESWRWFISAWRSIWWWRTKARWAKSRIVIVSLLWHGFVKILLLFLGLISKPIFDALKKFICVFLDKKMSQFCWRKSFPLCDRSRVFEDW